MERFKPDIYQENVFNINYDRLKEEGIKYLLFDLDNTLLPYSEKELTKEVIDLINKLKEDFEIVLFSNSSLYKLKKINESLNVKIIPRAFKPLKRNFKKIFKKGKCTCEEVAIIGDQLLTDIRGGNKVNITTILVKPMSPEDMAFTKINRMREERIFKKLGASGLLLKGRYYE